MIPCLVQLIQHVIKGMQVVAMPTDPEMARGQKIMSPWIIAKRKKTQEEKIKSMLVKVCKDNYWENKKRRNWTRLNKNVSLQIDHVNKVTRLLVSFLDINLWHCEFFRSFLFRL